MIPGIRIYPSSLSCEARSESRHSLVFYASSARPSPHGQNSSPYPYSPTPSACASFALLVCYARSLGEVMAGG